MQQQTIRRPVLVSGVGLHSGAPARVELRPAGAGVGLRFVQLGAPDAGAIPAAVGAVSDTRLATTLAGSGWSIRTVEHLLAAVSGVGLDNLEIAVDGPEIPVLDGTAAPWVEALVEAGTQLQEAPRRVLVVDTQVRIETEEGWLQAEPCDELRLDLTIDFDHPLIGTQRLEWVEQAGAFSRDLAWARTFGFERDIAALRRMGLGLGGSLDNVLVFSQDDVLNPGGLHRPDEPVRHKAMDLLGDLILIGSPVRARIRAHRPGHGRVIALVRALLAREDAWHLESSAATP